MFYTNTFKPTIFTFIIEIVTDFVRLFGFGYQHVIAINPSDSVLLILDAVDIYSDILGTKTISNINKLVKYANDNKVPIMYTVWSRTKQNRIDDYINYKNHWSYFIPERTHIIKEVMPPSGLHDCTIFNTINTDAFMPGLDSKNATAISPLHEIMGTRNTLVVCGTWTESCVINTVRSAAQLNKKVVVVKGSCASYSKLTGNISLVTCNKLYADVCKNIKFVADMKVGALKK